MGPKQLQETVLTKQSALLLPTVTCLQANSEINLAFTGAVKHGLVVAPFDATVTTNEGISVFYPYAGEQPVIMSYPRPAGCCRKEVHTAADTSCI